MTPLHTQPRKLLFALSPLLCGRREQCCAANLCPSVLHDAMLPALCCQVLSDPERRRTAAEPKGSQCCLWLLWGALGHVLRPASGCAVQTCVCLPFLLLCGSFCCFPQLETRCACRRAVKASVLKPAVRTYDAGGGDAGGMNFDFGGFPMLQLAS